MATNESSAERRLFTRFPARDQAMVAINSRLGELIDIGFGGLAFRYTGARPWFRQKIQSAMLCGVDDFCLQLPLSLVSDAPLAADNGRGHTRMRRCSMRFGALDAAQLIQLIAFIRDNTIEEELPEPDTLLPSAR